MRDHLEKIAWWAVKIGLWLIPILPLYVSTSLLFPFITGKNFVFRIAIEFLFVWWIGLAFLRKEYRPSWTPLLKAVTAFMAILFLADFFGPNPYRSFFSNYERMEGFMMLIHLYGYFIMLLSVFKTKRDWMIFFHSTLLVSLAVAFIGFLQRLGIRVSLQGGFRVDSTIGNPSYLAAYLLFHVWLILLLLRQGWQKFWLQILYALALVFELLIIYFTATRGAILGLIPASIIFVAGLVFFWPKVFPQKSSWRKPAIAVLVFLVLVPIVFWQLRNTNFVKSSLVLQRLTSVSFRERTIQSRFDIWRMSFKGAMSRPILGWGQENYYLVFQKYFNSALFANEPWFDRSHNIILDWLVHAGILGLGSYLAIIILWFRAIGGGVKNFAFSFWEGLVLVGLALTYFLQNLFVFDNLNTYLLFFAFLAYADYASDFNLKRPGISWRAVDAIHFTKAASVAVVAFIFFLVAGYTLHLKPIYEAKTLIRALQINQPQTPPTVLADTFKQALSYNTFGDTEVREQLASMARDMPNRDNFSAEERSKFVALAVEELKKEIATPAKDVKHMLFLASVLDRAVKLNPAYALEAEGVLKEAIQISPTKQILYFELAQLYLQEGKFNEAVEALKISAALDHRYYQATVNLLIVGVLTKRPDIVAEAKKNIDLGVLDFETEERLGSIYRNSRDYASARDVYEDLIRKNLKNAQYHATLAALWGELGKYKLAQEEVKIAVQLDPNFRQESEQFLKILEQRIR